LKLARRRRRLLATSPQSRFDSQKVCGFIPDTEASPPSSPIAARRMRKLTLFDSPRTPRSIMRSMADSPRRSWRSKGINSPAAAPLIKPEVKATSYDSPKVDPGITINPFTPANRNSGKKSRVSIRAAATSRYKSEFIELSRLGQGEFGAVYRVVNRFDGCVYAVKKTRRPIKGSQDENSAIKEVCAHAVLGKHKNVVRYYSAWCENDRMLIQSEYCNGGSLSDVISNRREKGRVGFNSAEIRELIRQLSSGLNYIHKKELAHLDIKPGNIFRSFSEITAVESSTCHDRLNTFEEDNQKVVYKIGDLGHVSPIDKFNIEEGDCRYASRELIQGSGESVGDPGEYRDVRKSDIFALGLTLYEATSLAVLPKNGEVWHEIRTNGVPYCENISDDFNQLITDMIDSIPAQRPTAHEIHEHHSVSNYMSNIRLQKLLQEEINKNKRLQRELLATQAAMKIGKLQTINGSTPNKRICI
jgi:wee1-like protein kinase